uniref:F-box domain-containing protein n=1 Tax=Oryza meridionalis TaxID=40149 RepID=A0A0E0DEN6_9ORYZ
MGTSDVAGGDGGLPFPYDVLLDILRRLPGRALAVSRCVCREWRAIVDAHGLLLPHVFPREFPGIFINAFGCRRDAYFYAPPGADADADDGRRPFHRPLDWSDRWDVAVKHHCNGLVLLHSSTCSRSVPDDACLVVCNPATGPLAAAPALAVAARHDVDCSAAVEWIGSCRIVGFHPHRDDVLIVSRDSTVLACHHLGTATARRRVHAVHGTDVGLLPVHASVRRLVYSPLPYRSCYVDALPDNGGEKPRFTLD